MKNTDNKPFPFFRGKLFLYQPKEHKVSVDLVLFLSKVRGIRKSSKVVDLGAGFGFISLVLAKKFGVRVTAVEVDDCMLSLLKKNVELNELTHLIDVVKADVKEIGKHFKKGSFDVVVANPPFYLKEHSPNPDPYHFEVKGTLQDFIKASAYLLRDGGYLNLLAPAFRLAESFSHLEKHNLPPRFLSLVYPTFQKKARLSIITSIKNVKGPLDVDKPLVINTERGDYTEEVRYLLENFL